MRGGPVVRIRFDTATCRACPVRSACTQAKEAPRQLTVRPQARHEALQVARQRQETAAFKAQYAQRAGVEGTHSQGVRRCGLRRARYIGLAKTIPSEYPSRDNCTAYRHRDSDGPHPSAV
jgi:transposase